jgi:hypothetical protein
MRIRCATAIAGMDAEIAQFRLKIADKKAELAVRNAELNDFPDPQLFAVPAEPEGLQAYRNRLLAGATAGGKILLPRRRSRTDFRRYSVINLREASMSGLGSPAHMCSLSSSYDLVTVGYLILLVCLRCHVSIGPSAIVYVKHE